MLGSSVTFVVIAFCVVVVVEVVVVVVVVEAVVAEVVAMVVLVDVTASTVVWNVGRWVTGTHNLAHINQDFSGWVLGFCI